MAHHAVIAATHAFSANFIVDARFGYGRFNLHALKDGAEAGANLGEKLGVKNANQGPFSYGLPIFSPSSYTGIGGPASLPTIRLENTFNPNISFTKIKGAHTIKFGTNIVRRQIIDFQTNQGDGLYSFDPTFTSDPNNTGKTGDSMASFLLGTVSPSSCVWPSSGHSCVRLDSQSWRALMCTVPMVCTVPASWLNASSIRNELSMIANGLARCAYAADAYARTTGRPGVLSVTAGCGLTNAVTGLCVAGLTGSPVVCIAGQHPTAVRVAGFRVWLGLGYCVTKGERAIRIWAPCPP